MSVYSVYIFVAIGGSLAAIYGMVTQWVKHVSDRTRHSVALERNTEVTEKLNGSIERLGEQLGAHEKRIDKLEYHAFGWGHD